MLYNDEEIEIMSNAIQPGMRKPGISPKVFQKIFDDFLSGVGLRGKRVLDVGPGQWDMLDILKKHGAVTVGLDNDPAVCELGKSRGHEARFAEFTEGWPVGGESFDGIFCRGSINIYWFAASGRIQSFLDALTGSLSKDGWLWIAPWNRPSESESDEVIEVARHAIDTWASRHGIQVHFPSGEVSKQYGIGYVIPQVELWTRFPRT